MCIIYFYFLFFFQIIISLKFQSNLTMNQWILIKKILRHPNTSFSMRDEINKVIYNKYETWAIHKAYEFKRFHKYKCRNLNINDLILFSLEGLKKATIKYNGSSSFYLFANIYISGQLYKGLTKLQPITNIPKSIRSNKKNDLKTNYNLHYKKILNTLFVSYDDYWMFEKRQDLSYNVNPFIRDNYFYEIWNVINDVLDPFSKKIFNYKYDYFFNEINSNKKIGYLMCCSEETVRQNLKKTKILLSNYTIGYDFRIIPNIC